MRIIVLALLLALALSTAQAYPLQGGNENVKATLFGAVRTSLGDQNATEEILRLDLGLLGAENATYQLVDSNNNIIQPSSYNVLQPGRQILLFLIPKDDLFKFIAITPTTGNPFNINWWETPKGSNSDIIIRYYGITDWLADPDQQALVLQLRIGNNGTSALPIGPENFTLLDHWGWDYYPVAGFDPVVLEPERATGRVLIGFTGLSPLSRAAALAYDYGEPDQIIIDLDKDQGPLSDAVVYGTNATENATANATVAQVEAAPAAAAAAPAVAAPQPSPSEPNVSTAEKVSSLKDEINATKQRLSGSDSGGSAASESSAVGKKINTDVEDARLRLEKMKMGLAADA